MYFVQLQINVDSPIQFHMHNHVHKSMCDTELQVIQQGIGNSNKAKDSLTNTHTHTIDQCFHDHQYKNYTMSITHVNILRYLSIIINVLEGKTVLHSVAKPGFFRRGLLSH
jgi:hypothetical protein